MKTAVQFFDSEIWEKSSTTRLRGEDFILIPYEDYFKIFEKARKLENQQIKFFFDKGHLYSGCQYGFEEIYLKSFNLKLP